MGLSGGGDIFASCSFGGTWGILLLFVLLKAFFGRQFSWWKITFFLSSFLLVLLVLLVDCYVVHCPSFASFA
jgi:hypothetical protein